MWIEAIEVECLGPFTPSRPFASELKHGAVGIFGANGTGKSTLLSLMYAGLTNDFGRFPGVKADCINLMAGPKDRAFVRLEVRHGSGKFTILRSVQPNKSELRLEGGRPITNSDRITEELEELLHVDANLLNLYVFKKQDAIYDFLQTTPTARAKAYQALCRTEYCEQIWNLLGTVLNRDIALRTEVLDNSDELQTSINQADEQLATIEQELVAKKPLLLHPDNLQRANGILAARRSWLQVEAERQRLKLRNEMLMAEQTKAQETAFAAEKEHDQQAKKVAALKGGADDSRAWLADWNRYTTLLQQQRKLQQEREALDAEEGTFVVPAQPDTGGKTHEELVKERLTKQQLLAESQRTLRVFEAEGVIACPTCGTKVTTLQGHLKALRSQVATLPKQLEKLGELDELCRSYQVSLQSYQRWQAGFTARRQANERALQDIQQLKAPEGKKEDHTKKVRLYDEAYAELCSRRERQEVLGRAATAASARNFEVEGHLNRVTTQLQDYVVKDEMVAKAERRLQEHRQVVEEIRGLEGRRLAISQRRDVDVTRLAALRQQHRQRQRIKEQVAVLERARSVLARDALPAMVSQYNLQNMVASINNGLEWFASPFWVEADEDLSFLVHKPGEPAQSAERLSGGQKVVLAIAFWAAVNSIFRHEIGMMALDEPTAHLDLENRNYLGSALKRLTAQLRGQQQLLLVSHAENLRHSFDQVIDLSL